jgi:hypothetical protein
MDCKDLRQYVNKKHLNNPDASVIQIYENLFEPDAPFKRLFYWLEECWDGTVLAIYEHIGADPYYVCARGYFLSIPEFWPPEEYLEQLFQTLDRGLTIHKHLTDIDVTEFDHPDLRQKFLNFLKQR